MDPGPCAFLFLKTGPLASFLPNNDRFVDRKTLQTGLRRAKTAEGTDRVAALSQKVLGAVKIGIVRAQPVHRVRKIGRRQDRNGVRLQLELLELRLQTGGWVGGRGVAFFVAGGKQPKGCK